LEILDSTLLLDSRIIRGHRRLRQAGWTHYFRWWKSSYNKFLGDRL